MSPTPCDRRPLARRPPADPIEASDVPMTLMLLASTLAAGAAIGFGVPRAAGRSRHASSAQAASKKKPVERKGAKPRRAAAAAATGATAARRRRADDAPDDVIYGSRDDVLRFGRRDRRAPRPRSGLDA